MINTRKYDIPTRTKRLIRNLILDGFSMTNAVKEDLLNLYDDIIPGNQDIQHDLRRYGVDQYVPQSKVDEWQLMANDGLKIPVIRDIRAVTDLGLKEAKELSEKMFVFAKRH